MAAGVLQQLMLASRAGLGLAAAVLAPPDLRVLNLATIKPRLLSSALTRLLS